MLLLLIGLTQIQFAYLADDRPADSDQA